MVYNPDIHHRRSIRLHDYDYAGEGFYFVTICVHDRCTLFGSITDGTMHMNDAGRMVEEEYRRLPNRYPHITCHEYVVMPNHFHAIIQITNDNASPVGAPLVGAHENHQGTHEGCPYGDVTLGEIVGARENIPRVEPNENHQGTHKGCPYSGVTLGEIVGAFKSITTNGEYAFCTGLMPNTVGKTDDLKIIYDEIYKSGPLQYEIETFDLNGNCKIKFIRKK